MRNWWPFLLLAMFLGCAGTQRRQSLDQVRTRAAVDFSCATESIRTDVLDSYRDLGERYRQIRATGCGKEAVYVRATGGAWVLNSEVRDLTSASSGGGQRRSLEPSFAFSEDEGQVRGMRVSFRSIDASITVTYAADVSSDLRVDLASTTALPLSGCESFTIRAGTTEHTVSLNEDHSGRVAFERLALLGADRSRADFCGRTWLVTSSDRRALVRMRDEIARIRAQPQGNASDSDESAPAASDSHESVPAAIRAVLNREAPLIRACLNQAEGPITLEARWTAAGMIEIDVTSQDDIAVDECVQAGLPEWAVHPTEAGRLVHVIR